MNLKLSKTAEQGIKALIRLGQSRDGRPVSGRILAENQGLKYDTMLRSLRLLDRARLVRVHRGSSGGYEFARDPESITILAVIEAIEGKFDTDFYVGNEFKQDESEGKLKAVFQAAIKECINILSSRSISYLFDREKSAPDGVNQNDTGVESPKDSDSS